MLINLAYLLDRPTGTTAYALNLLPYLQPLSPTYLATPASGLAPDAPTYIAVPSNMTQGTTGHLRRLWWTQFQLPKLYDLNCEPNCKKNSSRLLFSPIPEVPLAIRSSHRSGHRSGHRCVSVVTCHDLTPLRFPEMFGAIKYYYRYYVPQVLAQAERVICNSEATARDVVDFYGIAASKLVPIPLAYDATHFRPATEKPKLLGHDDLTRQPYFLMLGRQVPYKNMAPAIAAMAQLPDHRLLIAGPTDARYTPELKAMAEELNVGSRVKFLSYVPYDQLPALLSHAVALVFPSLWEGFGLPVLEAMACGTPVITSNVASLPEVAGDAAYLIDNPLDFEAIANAMNTVAHDSQMRQQLSEAGLQRVRQFSWEKTGKATTEVLRCYL